MDHSFNTHTSRNKFNLPRKLIYWFNSFRDQFRIYLSSFKDLKNNKLGKIN